MTLIKIAKTGQKITVEGCWVCMDGKRVAHEVGKIDPWTTTRVTGRRAVSAVRVDPLVMRF